MNNFAGYAQTVLLFSAVGIFTFNTDCRGGSWGLIRLCKSLLDCCAVLASYDMICMRAWRVAFCGEILTFLTVFGDTSYVGREVYSTQNHGTTAAKTSSTAKGFRIDTSAYIWRRRFHTTETLNGRVCRALCDGVVSRALVLGHGVFNRG